MLSAQHLKGVQELINIIIESEKNLEVIRVDLCEQPLFSMKPIFERFDQARRGQIDSGDVLAFCDDNEIEITGAEAYYLNKSLDKNQDGKVTFDDLTHVFLPKGNQRSRIVTALREPYFITKNMMLPSVIEQGVSDFLREMLYHFRKQQHVKHKLLSQEDFNIFNVHRMIDLANKGYIDFENLQEFINSNSLEINIEDLKYFFWHSDKNEDGKISYNEFIELLMNTDMKPRQPSDPQRKLFVKNASRIHQFDTRTPEKNRRNDSDYRTSTTPEPQHNYMLKKMEQTQTQNQTQNQTQTQYTIDQDPGSFRLTPQTDYSRPVVKNEKMNEKQNVQPAIKVQDNFEINQDDNRYYQFKPNDVTLSQTFGSSQIKQAKLEYPVEQLQQPSNQPPTQKPVHVYTFSLHQQLKEVDDEVNNIKQRSVNDPNQTSNRSQKYTITNYNNYSGKSQNTTPVRPSKMDERIYNNITPDTHHRRQLKQAYQPMQSVQPPTNARQYNTPERVPYNRKELNTTPEKVPEKDPQEGNEYQKYISHLRQQNNPNTSQSNVKLLKCSLVEANQPAKSQQMTQQTTYSLFRFLLKSVLVMREVEELKRQLALRNDFNLLDAFRLFDKDGAGQANSSSVMAGFQELGIKTSQFQLQLLLNQHCKRKDDVLRYSDFTRMILPHTPDYNILLQNRAPTFNQSSNINELFSPTTIQYLKELLSVLLTTEETLKKYKSLITEDPVELYKELDTDQKGYIDDADFRNLFAQYDVHPTALELRRVITRFNPVDEQVNTQQFVNQLS